MSSAAAWVPLVFLLAGYPSLEDGVVVAPEALAPCAGPRFEVGELAAGAARASGFHAPERSRGGRRFAWARRESEVWLALGEGSAPRRLVLSAAGVVEGLGVRAVVNGVDLGERRLSKEFGETAWPLPDGALRPGWNAVRLVADAERRPGPDRRLAVATEGLRVEPDAAACPGRGGGAAATLPATLEAGAVLFARLPVLPPDGRLRVRTSGAPGALLDILVGVEERRLPAATLAVPASGGGEELLELPACCGVDRGLFLAARGPAAVRVEALEMEGDGSARAWRRACGNLAPQLLAVAGLAGLFLVAAWRGWKLPLARWAPWVDLLVVLALGLAARELFLAAYPLDRSGLWPDAGEYLRRARALADGQSSFLGDLYWHRWQTWLRPPGYYLFLAQLDWLGVESMAAIVRVQTLLWVTTALSTYVLGHLLFGRAAALFAGVLYALSLEALTYSSAIATEALFMPLLVPALALLVWLGRRPDWRWGLATGLLFGMAAMVRSAPVLFVPAAAALFGLGRGFRRSMRPMAALVLGLAAVAVPWSVRNSLLVGKPMGVDNVVVPNFLISHPDELYLAPGSLDLTSEEGQQRYYWRLKKGGEELAGAPIMRRGLVRLATRPLHTLRLAGVGLTRFFHPRTWRFAEIVGEKQPCGMGAIAALLNWQTFPVLLLALVGIVLRAGDRSTWPVLFWFLLILGTSVILFPLAPADLPRYRFSTMPVLLAYAGWALAHLHGRLGRRLRRAG